MKSELILASTIGTVAGLFIYSIFADSRSIRRAFGGF